MNNQIQGDPRLARSVQQAMGQMTTFHIGMMKRFDEINSIKQYYKQEYDKMKPEEQASMEMSQLDAIADMMMENTLDYCGVKR